MSYMNDVINKHLDDFKHNLDPKDCEKINFDDLLEGVKFKVIKELEENHSDLSGNKISMVDKFIDNYKKQEIYESYCEMCNSNCVDIDNLYDF